MIRSKSPLALSALIPSLAILLLLAGSALAQGPGSNSTFGNGMILDGNDGFAWMSPNASGASEGTVEVWVLANSTPSSYQVWGGGNGLPGVNGDWMKLGAHPQTTGLSMGLFVGLSWRWAGNGVVPVGAWTHLAGTWGADGIKIYVDGELVGTNAYNGASSAYTTELVGSSAWGGYFDGAVDDLRIWDHVRSQSQIQASMDDPLAPSVYQNGASGLVAYYRFEEFEDLGVGADGADDLRDDSVSGNHADAEGGVSLGSGSVPVEQGSWGSLKSNFGR